VRRGVTGRFKGSRARNAAWSSGKGIPAISPVISGTAVTRRGKGRGGRPLTRGSGSAARGAAGRDAQARGGNCLSDWGVDRERSSADRWGRRGRCARRELVHARRWWAAAAERCRWGHAGLARVRALALGRARGEAAVLGRPVSGGEGNCHRERERGLGCGAGARERIGP
jgi:hypothetical protein